MNQPAPMSPYGHNDPLSQAVDFEMLEAGIETFRNQFQSATPFRYIVIENFLRGDAVRPLADQFPKKESNWVDSSGKHAKRKWTSPIIPGSHAEIFFEEVQSPRFTKWLEQLTGIEGFIHDDKYFGAGFHQTMDDGFLNVHIDFNKLPNGLDRRLNLLVYMNPVWEDNWGGELELWDMEKKECVKTIKPILNRAVLFETNEVSYHGQPNPVQTGGKTSRNSFSVYYYTQGRPSEEEAPYHSTVYVNTEGSKGKRKILMNTLEQIVTLKPLSRRLADRKQPKK